MARRLFSRRRKYGAERTGYGASEMRNAEREVFLFRRRLVVAGALMALSVVVDLYSTSSRSSRTMRK